MTDRESVLDSQLRYYSGLAWEYDETIPLHFAPAMPAMLKRMRAGNIKGDTLELASGTGYWTRYLSELSDSVTCLDGSPDMIAALRQRGLPDATGKFPSRNVLQSHTLLDAIHEFGFDACIGGGRREAHAGHKKSERWTGQSDSRQVWRGGLNHTTIE